MESRLGKSETSSTDNNLKVLQPWHPRITPFRLAFILSTTTFGILKAALVSKDETRSSTTVDWVGSVVFALTFQLLSPLEPGEHHNPVARFLFSQDCLTPLWKVVPRPSYIDDERQVHQAHDSVAYQKYGLGSDHAEALVTPYRLLVSVITAGFGIIKMSCAYAGLNATMDAMDWAFSVPVVLLLYFVGLYEDNSVGLARGFFDTDCSNGVIFVTTQGFHALLISGCSLFLPYWSKYWYNIVTESFHSPLIMLDPLLANDPIPLWVHRLHDKSLEIFSVSVMIACALLGVIPFLPVLLYFSGPILKAARWTSVCARRLLHSNALVGTIVSGVGDTGTAVRPYAFPFLTNLVIIGFYALAVFLCFDFGIFALGLGLRVFPSLYMRTDVLVLKILDAIMAVTFGAASYAPFKGGWVVFKELLQRVSVLRQNSRRGVF